MNAQELRIGNLVMFGELRHECKPCDILNLYQSEIAKSEISEYKPIPLTEEWLLKAGFEKDSKSLFHPQWLTDNLKGYCIYCENIEYVKGCDPRPHIKYIHQIQNLYFSLTGKELTI